MRINNQPFPESLREKIEFDTELFFHKLTSSILEEEVRPDSEGYCLFWANAAVFACLNNDVDAQLHAGSANWRLNRRPKPLPTHIGHFWSCKSNEDVHEHLSKGRMPEMHCWAFAPEWGAILDPSTRGLPSLAMNCDIECSENIPSYFIGSVMPKDWSYTPSVPATKVAHYLTGHIMGQYVIAKVGDALRWEQTEAM